MVKVFELLRCQAVDLALGGLLKTPQGTRIKMSSPKGCTERERQGNNLTIYFSERYLYMRAQSQLHNNSREVEKMMLR